LLLAVVVLAAFWPALKCGFVNFDDNVYVTENPQIQHGLNWSSVKWAFTATHAGYWLPLTWLSHMADYQFFQLHPAGHHLTSLLWHAANSVVLFLFLKRLTGAFWRSALVAALFALHPLRVESVVWVAERKDVLSTFFGWLSLWCYARFADDFKSQSSKFKLFYGAALLLYALSLMAKPTLVTLPFVLLLLDFWPLGRWRFARPFPWRLLAEKVPFFVLALGCSAATFLAQNSAGAVKSLSRYSFGQRLGNVPVSYVRYLGKIFWPENLAAFYPPQRWQGWEIAAATLVLVLATGWVLWLWRSRPYLAVGWLWFLGTLVPTIGLVQSGDQAMADRFSYVPCVGILIMVAWGMDSLAARWPLLCNGLRVGSGLAVLACAVLTFQQIRYWKDTAAMFSHAIEVTGRNFLAFYNMGCLALGERDYPKAIQYFEACLVPEADEIAWCNRAPAHNNLGCALLLEGRVAQAVAHFEKALAIQSAFPEAYYNLGRAFLTNRQPDVAIDCFQHGLAIDPNVPEINCSLGTTLSELGRPAEAVAYLENALRIRPAFAHAHYQLAKALARQGRAGEAIAHYQRARELALAQGNPALAAAADAQLRQYQSDSPAQAPPGARLK
jgi:tetratricopeptide (TPR) repeat protein